MKQKPRGYGAFAKKAESLGFAPRKCSEWHWQIQKNGITLNYYPTKKTLYIQGAVDGYRLDSLSDVWEIAEGKVEIVGGGDKKIKNPRELRDRLYFMGHDHCWICKKLMQFDETTLEHKVPRHLGGSNRPDNLTLSHAACNQKRGHELIPEPERHAAV